MAIPRFSRHDASKSDAMNPTKTIPPPLSSVVIARGSIPSSASQSSLNNLNKIDNEISSTSNRETNIQVCIRMRPLLVIPSSSPSKPPPTTTTATPTTPNVNDNTNKTTPNKLVSRFQKPTASFRSKIPTSKATGITRQNSMSETPKVIQDYAWDVMSESNVIQQANWSNPDPSRKNSYAFDKVFGPSTSTSEIYNSSIRPIVHASVDGYHGSVFAYGQTSTGKTYTMQGTRKDPGVVPLAVEDLFKYITMRNADVNYNREFLLRVSYMEIYNEQINDLLATSVSASSSRGKLGGPRAASSQIRIFENKNEGVVIRGLKEEIVTSPKQVYQLIATGEANRQTGSTSLNKHSSRSHSIFRVVIESRAKQHVSTYNVSKPNNDKMSDIESVSSAGSDLNKPIRISSLSLVDLAGSESVKATGSQGERLKEGQYINKSLMTLGHVIFKLSERADATSHGEHKFGNSYQHIPYRDSKLTRLMQMSLSGNAQICIVCNVSPSMKNIEETHNTLKFALRAKRIKQMARINEVKDDRTLLQNYKEEIEFLKQQLKEAREAKKSALTNEEGLKKKGNALTAEEDSKALVKAIKNLETLILSRNTPLKKPGGEDEDSLLDDSSDSPLDLRLGDTKQALFTNGTENAIKENEDAPSDESDEEEKKDSVLFDELHRIQNLLGNVLHKSKSPSSYTRKNSQNDPNKSPVTPLPPLSPSEQKNIAIDAEQKVEDTKKYSTPQRDQEMESLRLQLKKQAMVTSLRKADSSFLENQLNEKER